MLSVFPVNLKAFDPCMVYPAMRAPATILFRVMTPVAGTETTDISSPSMIVQDLASH